MIVHSYTTQKYIIRVSICNYYPWVRSSFRCLYLLYNTLALWALDNIP